MKKIITILFLIVVLICAKLVFSFNSPSNKTLNYTALGDSIAAGVGAENNCGYTYMLQEYFNTIYKQVNYSNVAQSGDTSEDLLKKLVNSSEIRTSVQNADVITICIGANDLLGGVEGLMQGNFLAIDNKINTFSQNWIKINNIIRELNPTCAIYVMDIYNPIQVGDNYGGITINQNLMDIIESYIKKLNFIITAEENVTKYNYNVANIYLSFDYNKDQDSLLTNFKTDSDPHPTDLGHELIYQQHLILIPEIK